MRACLATFSVAVLLALPSAAADRRFAVRGAPDGAVILLPETRVDEVDVLRPRPDAVLVVVRGRPLTSDTFHPRATWIETVRVLGPELVGKDESRILLELASSALEPRILDHGTWVEVVLTGMAPVARPPSSKAPADAAPHLRDALPASASAGGPADDGRATDIERRRERERRRARWEAGREQRREARAARRNERRPGHSSSRDDVARRWDDAPSAAVGNAAGEPLPAAPPLAEAAPGRARSSGTRAASGSVIVPAGEFLMGTPAGAGFADESPEHRVWLATFSIDRTEVTVEEFQRSPLTLPRQPEWNWGVGQPVVNVTWHQADEYCEWLGKRLPTEAEWEKAARGTDARRFPWGNRWNASLANSGEGADGVTHAAPTGSFPDGASPYGALDMSGNVWEWVRDWYDADYFAASPLEAPTGPVRGATRVTRGGSYSGRSSFNVRATVRRPLKGSARRENVGFRCAAD